MSTSDLKDRSRRHFLFSLSAGTAAAALGCGGGGMMEEPVDAGPVDVGPVSSFAVGDYKIVRTGNFIVARDDRGFFAYTRRCTHNGCSIPAPTLSAGELRSSCPCHHSIFDGNGDLVSGAVAGQASLAHFTVSFMGTGEAARVIVDPGTLVNDRNSRAVPPA